MTSAGAALTNEACEMEPDYQSPLTVARNHLTNGYIDEGLSYFVFAMEVDSTLEVS